MNSVLTIKGMHCNACKALITMELEEKGLDDKIASISINEVENVGQITFEGVSAEDIDVIQGMIESLDKYSVISKENS